MKSPSAKTTNRPMAHVASKMRASLRALMAARLLIAIVALAAVALASYATPAQAQSEVTLVTNYGSRHATELLYVGDNSAQL